VAVCAALLFAPNAARAQNRVPDRPRLAARAAPEIGVRGDYNFDLEAAGVGGQARLPVLNVAELLPSADYFFDHGTTSWQAGLDLAIRIGFRQALYAGAGAALVHRRFEEGAAAAVEDSRFGTALFAGLATPRLAPMRLRPYVEARWVFVGDFPSEFAVLAGVNVRLGR
jgi:hypothetical protein